MKGSKQKNQSMHVTGPALAVDTIIFSIVENRLQVLLIQIAAGPYKSKWALPGGLVRPKESLEEAAERVLSEKAGVDDIYLEQLATFGKPDRDIRDRSVSVAYFALVNSASFHPKTTDYYSNIGWKSVDRLPDMAFDHREMIRLAHKRLASKLGYSNIVYGLLPREFTLSELQSLYEVIIGKPFDKRNFRKKILDIKLVSQTGKIRREGASRPAKLYTFAERKLRVVDVL